MATTRILVIEDDLPSRVMLARGVQRLGYAVDAMPDAVEAQTRILDTGSAAYDAAMIDLRMPKMDGLEFITWLEGVDPSLGCMLLSAQQDDTLLHDERIHPALLFRLRKPTSFPVLGEALAQIVDFTRAERARKSAGGT